MGCRNGVTTVRPFVKKEIDARPGLPANQSELEVLDFAEGEHLNRKPAAAEGAVNPAVVVVNTIAAAAAPIHAGRAEGREFVPRGVLGFRNEDGAVELIVTTAAISETALTDDEDDAAPANGAAKSKISGDDEDAVARGVARHVEVAVDDGDLWSGGGT